MKVGKYSTSIGTIIIHTTDEDVLHHVGFSETYAIAQGNIAPLTFVVNKVLATIESGAEYDLPLADSHGTPFQKEVWRALRRIPYGKTVTYQDVANDIGRGPSVRAVANAIGRNPFAVIIPCHRVIRSDGELGGYRWGADVKNVLLKRESNELLQRSL
jgi:O-6-methylguanine DNA methyltransferase